MKIAYTMLEGRGELDRLLADFAEALQAREVRTLGVVQINTDCETSHRCDMDVQVLPEGPRIRISQYLGKEAKGCRLDPDALERAVAEVGQRMEAPFDIFLLNKFGKQEASGRGFSTLIGEALEKGAAVIVGANGLNKERFEEFSGGLAEQVPPEIDALMAWYSEA